MKTSTVNDPILDEVRQAREDILREAGGDMQSLMNWLLEAQKHIGRNLVSRTPEAYVQSVKSLREQR